VPTAYLQLTYLLIETMRVFVVRGQTIVSNVPGTVMAGGSTSTLHFPGSVKTYLRLGETIHNNNIIIDYKYYNSIYNQRYYNISNTQHARTRQCRHNGFRGPV